MFGHDVLNYFFFVQSVGVSSLWVWVEVKVGSADDGCGAWLGTWW